MKLTKRCGLDILTLNKISYKKKFLPKPYQLGASLICADPLNLQSEITRLEQGGIDYVHFDVMDNQFVPRFGLYPEMLIAVKKLTSLPVVVHLMVENPEKAIPIFATAGGDTLVIHVETTKHLHRLLTVIKQSGVNAGVALNPATGLDVLDYVIEEIDLVLLMAINPGIVGHKLIPNMIAKITATRSKLKSYPNISIEVDGGVTFESARAMVKSGARMLVCGSSTIFSPEGDIIERIKKLRENIL